MEWVDCGVWEVGVLGTVALRAGEWRSELAALWLCDMWFLGGGVLQVKALSKRVELKQLKGCDRGTQGLGVGGGCLVSSRALEGCELNDGTFTRSSASETFSGVKVLLCHYASGIPERKQ